MRKYFPDNAEKVDKAFMWGIFWTKHPDLAEKYYKAVLDDHAKDKKKKLPEKKRIQISDKWLKLLAKYPHKRK